jgi:hypothetical protein
MDCNTLEPALHVRSAGQVRSLYATLQGGRDDRAKRGQRYTAAQT